MRPEQAKYRSSWWCTGRQQRHPVRTDIGFVQGMIVMFGMSGGLDKVLALVVDTPPFARRPIRK